MDPVLLLRAPAEEGPDPYETVFRTRGYAPISVPVLETLIVNLNDLKKKVAVGPKGQGLSGVIITSKRAIEAWSKAVEELSAPDSHSGPHSPADWGQVPFYVVGSATASAASSIRTKFPSSTLTPVDIRGGAESGSAERLADFILKDLPSSNSDKKTLLYLTGDKNLDTLPQKLSSANIALDSIEVYRTGGSSSFQADLDTALKKAPIDATQCWGWVVFFAPSAAEFTLPYLHKVFQIRDAYSSTRDSTGKPTIKVAAIGTTTASALRDKLGLQVDVVPKKQASGDLPSGLASAIIAFDSV